MEEIKKYYKLAKENKKITMAIIIVIIMLIALIN
jgi:hypothetical protein|tara:strand:- start:2010 stop:2111 length:102 start_codon:yes stop_codon:yes gene_type:complete